LYFNKKNALFFHTENCQFCTGHLKSETDNKTKFSCKIPTKVKPYFWMHYPTPMTLMHSGNSRH